MIAKSGPRQVPEPQRAVAQLRTVAKPYRFRVQADAEGFPIIPGRHGQIEWYCDGVNCSSCALPGQFALAVYTDRPRLFAKLWAIPGAKRHQTGDTEMRALFPLEALEQIAGVIRAKRKRSGPSLNSLANLRPRAGSGIQNRRSRPELGQRPDGR